jgi:hypothetical protein
MPSAARCPIKQASTPVCYGKPSGYPGTWRRSCQITTGRESWIQESNLRSQFKNRILSSLNRYQCQLLLPFMVVDKHKFFKKVGVATRPSLTWVLIAGIAVIGSVLLFNFISSHAMDATWTITIIGTVAVTMLAKGCGTAGSSNSGAFRP